MSAEASRDRAWLKQQAGAAGGLRPLCGGAAVLGGWLVIPQAALLAGLVHSVVVEGAGRGAVVPLLAALLTVLVLRSACTGVQEWAAAGISRRVHEAVRDRLWRRVAALGPAGAAQETPGGLATAAVEQVGTLGPFVGRFQPQLLATALVPPAILVAAFTQDWLAAGLLLFAAPLIPLFMALVGMGAESVSRSQHQALARLGGYFVDRLQGLDLLRHLGRGEDEAQRLAEAGEGYRRRTMAVLRVAFLSSAVLEFFSAVAIAMVAVYIGMGLLGYLTFGPAPDLTLFSGLFVLLLAPEFFQPLRQLAQHYHDRAAALGAAAELRPLLERPSPMPAGGAEPPPAGPVPIETRGLTVRSPDGATLLEGIDLDLPAGEALVITGESGSGKTTLLHALAGFLGADAGALRVAGTPLAELDQGAWRRSIGWLAQNPVLLPGTLRENLTLGQRDAAPEHQQEAMERAGLGALLARRPHGLETRVGERGQGLSGGEAQRLALARVLLRRPALLLVDEPTASLDPTSARLVTEALAAENRRGATVVIATHDPALCPWASHRLHLDAGRVTEAGHG